MKSKKAPHKRPVEYRPCPKSKGDMKEQRRRGTIIVNRKRYGLFECCCTGHKHINRIPTLSAATVNRRPEYQVEALHGRSIFGQVMPKGLTW